MGGSAVAAFTGRLFSDAVHRCLFISTYRVVSVQPTFSEVDGTRQRPSSGSWHPAWSRSFGSVRLSVLHCFFDRILWSAPRCLDACLDVYRTGDFCLPPQLFRRRDYTPIKRHVVSTRLNLRLRLLCHLDDIRDFTTHGVISKPVCARVYFSLCNVPSASIRTYSLPSSSRTSGLVTAGFGENNHVRPARPSNRWVPSSGAPRKFKKSTLIG